jgi:phosphate transport system permease protein
MNRSPRDLAFRLATGGALAVSVLLPGLLLALIVTRGAGALSLEFLLRAPTEAGTKGGIAPVIFGTLLLIGTAGCLAAPMSLGLALLQTEYLVSTWRKRWLEMFLYTLNGIPSIVYGLFAFHLFVQRLGMGKSWLAGGVVLGVMILPTITISVLERIHALPRSYRTQARALGLGGDRVIRAVVVPHALPGLVTGTLLGLGRACGETAPIMMTAAVFAGPDLPRGIRDEPVLACPYHIFTLAQDSSSPLAVQNAWGTALVLVIMVLALGLASMMARRSFSQEVEML